MVALPLDAPVSLLARKSNLSFSLAACFALFSAVCQPLHSRNVFSFHHALDANLCRTARVSFFFLLEALIRSRERGSSFLTSTVKRERVSEREREREALSSPISDLPCNQIATTFLQSSVGRHVGAIFSAAGFSPCFAYLLVVHFPIRRVRASSCDCLEVARGCPISHILSLVL